MNENTNTNEMTLGKTVMFFVILFVIVMLANFAGIMMAQRLS